ncbi:MAG: GTP-binding protein [Candidatus Lokiarchaeota archaeon]|nr:GTP-binding protein [Candidatus Lokiarchaeota archaeon]
MSDAEKREFGLKLAILGDPAVGKTSLIDKYITGSFKENYQPTLGVNIVTKDIRIEEINSKIRLLLWDIAGQAKYELTRKMFFQGCSGALLVYDMTRYATFENLTSKWLEDFKNFGKPDGVFVLIGNKIDLKDSIKVSSEVGKSLSQKINAADFIETSAKYGENVEKAFKKIVLYILEKSGVKFESE